MEIIHTDIHVTVEDSSRVLRRVMHHYNDFGVSSGNNAASHKLRPGSGKPGVIYQNGTSSAHRSYLLQGRGENCISGGDNVAQDDFQETSDVKWKTCESGQWKLGGFSSVTKVL